MSIHKIQDTGSSPPVHDSKDVKESKGEDKAFQKTLEQKKRKEGGAQHKHSTKKEVLQKKKHRHHAIPQGEVLIAKRPLTFVDAPEVPGGVTEIRVPDIARKIVESLRVLQTKDLSRVDIELNLGKLGTGQIALVRHKDGGLIVNIQVSTQEAFESFQKSVHELGKNLLDKGVQVTEIQVQMPDGQVFRLERGSFESASDFLDLRDDSSRDQGQQSEQHQDTQDEKEHSE